MTDVETAWWSAPIFWQRGYRTLQCKYQGRWMGWGGPVALSVR